MGKAKRVSASVCVMGLMILATYQPAVANDAVEDVSRQLSDLRASIDSAEVFLIARDTSPIHNFGEYDVVRTGCRYIVKKATDLGSLMDVLVNARLTQVPENEDGYDGRVLIRLYQGGSVIRSLLLGPGYSNANSYGAYKVVASGSDRTFPVEAKNRIERDLRFWAAQHRSLAIRACGG